MIMNSLSCDDDTFDILKKIAEAGTEEEYIKFLKEAYNNECNFRRSRCDRKDNISR